MADDEDGASGIEEKAGVAAHAGAVIGEIAHAAGHAAAGPVEKVGGFREGRGGGNAGQIKARGQGQFL